MIKPQTIAEFAPSLIPSTDLHPGLDRTIAVIRMENFSSDSLAATAVYSRKDFFKISLITGHATFHYHDRAYLVKPGECILVFINPETPYRWEIHSGTCNGYACMFTTDFLPFHTHLRPTDWSIFEANQQSVFRLLPPERKLFNDLFLKMIIEQDSDYAGKYNLLFLYVLECIYQALKLQPVYETRQQRAATRLTESFKTLLAEQFPLLTPAQSIQLRSPQAFADKLAVHPNYLNRVIKTVTGKTTSQLLTERLVQEARALLLYSNWSIRQISDSLGFKEPTHFTKAFRNYTGHPPSAMRQKS